MNPISALEVPILQVDFAKLIGVSEAKVSQLAADGTIERGQPGIVWLRAYCERLREQAAGRASGEVGGLDLVQERAALAREQRHGYEIKNAVARGEYAAIGLLAEVLATASQSVVERFEQLPGLLLRAVPDLSDEARQVIEATIASARNEWVRTTQRLVVERMQELDEDDDPAGDVEFTEEGA